MSNAVKPTGEIVPEGIARLRLEVDRRVSTANALAVSPRNAASYDQVRKDNKQFIKEAIGEISALEEAVLAPYRDAEKAILGVIAPLEDANKELAERILQAKKFAFRGKIKAKLFDPFYGEPDDFGEIVPFDEVYDPSWYGKTETAVAHLLRTAVDHYKTGNSLVRAEVRIDCARNWELDEMERWLIEKHVAYSIDRKEIAK